MTDRTLVLTAPPDDVNAVHDVLDSLWAERLDIDEDDRMMFETAVIELVSNVIQHSASTAAVTCLVEIVADESSLHATFSENTNDSGFVITRREMPDVYAESGRGIAFIQALVNELTYDRIGGRNVWRIVKLRS